MFLIFPKVIKITSKNYEVYNWTPNMALIGPKPHTKLFDPKVARQYLKKQSLN